MNTPNRITSRDSGVDVIKAFATMLVIVGHVIQYTNPNYDQSPIFKLIYAFHMPLFMCISGYLVPKMAPVGFLYGKFKQLVIPFVVWSVIVTALNNYAASNYSEGGFGEQMLQVLVRPDKGLWFLWVLFLNCAVFVALQDKYRLLASFALIGFLYVLQFANRNFGAFGLDLFKWHYFFFLLGFIIKNTKLLPMTRKYLWLIIPLTVLALTQWHRVAVTSLFGLEVSTEGVFKLVTLAVKYIAAIGMLLLTFHLKGWLHFTNRTITFLANQSLGYYATQVVFIAIATLIWTEENYWHQAAVFAFTLLGCTAAIFLFDRIALTRKYVLGKSR